MKFALAIKENIQNYREKMYKASLTVDCLAVADDIPEYAARSNCRLLSGRTANRSPCLRSSAVAAAARRCSAFSVATQSLIVVPDI